MKAIRYRAAHVVPLELWDLEVRGQMLVEARLLADFPARVAEAVALLARGQARRRSGEPLDPRSGEFQTVWLGGGGAGDAVVAALGATPLYRSAAGRFAGEAGGHALLAAHGARYPLVVDMGQSAIKLSGPFGRRLIERDFAALPISPDDFDERSRAQTRHFVRQAIAAITATGPRPDAVVLALPSRIDDQLLPEGSTYSGMGGDGAFVAEALRDVADVPTVVLNDAELAALSAACDLPATTTPVLVLTLGFSVGGALLWPTQEPDQRAPNVLGNRP